MFTECIGQVQDDKEVRLLISKCCSFVLGAHGVYFSPAVDTIVYFTFRSAVFGSVMDHSTRNVQTEMEHKPFIDCYYI